MATRIGSATGTNTATPPTHQAGDILLVWAFRDGSATAPSLPSGDYFNIDTVAGTSCSARMAFKVAKAAGETLGTFTNATSVIVEVWRPDTDKALSIGASAKNNGVSTSINFPALTLQDSSSIVFGFCGHRSTDTTITTAPSGMTNRSSVSDATDQAAAHSTTAGKVSSWSSTSASVGGTSSGWCSMVLEMTEGTAAWGRSAGNNSLSVGGRKVTCTSSSDRIVWGFPFRGDKRVIAWDVTVYSAGGGGVGLATAAFSGGNAWPGIDGETVGYYADGHTYYSGGSPQSTTGPTWQQGDRIYLAVDRANNLLWSGRKRSGVTTWLGTPGVSGGLDLSGLGSGDLAPVIDVFGLNDAFTLAGDDDGGLSGQGFTAWTPTVVTGPVGRSDETDIALALGSARPVGLSTETDTALALTGKSIIPTGMATETDTALALSAVQIRATGTSTETDAALPLGSARPVGMSEETDTALALALVQVGAVGLCAETDEAFALAPVQILPVGIATESDAALALSAVQALPVGTATETDEALPMGSARPVGMAEELDEALQLSSGTSGPVGVALETDTAFALAAVQIGTVGICEEVDEAIALLPGEFGAVGMAVEVDEAFALGSARPPGIAIEVDIALALLASSEPPPPADAELIGEMHLGDLIGSMSVPGISGAPPAAIIAPTASLTGRASAASLQGRAEKGTL